MEAVDAFKLSAVIRFSMKRRSSSVSPAMMRAPSATVSAYMASNKP
jgi:hypothetical protein